MAEFLREAVFDILELEAKENYYIENSEKPFLIVCDGLGVPDYPSGINFTVYLADLQTWHYKHWKNCRRDIEKIVKAVISKGKKIYLKKRGKEKTLWSEKNGP